MKPVKGVILAGGQGKRLRPLTYYFQKCMIPIGNKQKPLLEYIIRLLKFHAITDISLLVGYKHEQIVNYFNNGSRFHVKITYSLDSEKLGGSGGSLLNLYYQGHIDREDTLVIYYGDILSNIDLSDLLNQHYQEHSAATLALSQGYRVPVGVAEIDGLHVVGWKEKPILSPTVGIGVLILEASLLVDLERLSNLGTFSKNLDIMSHYIPYLLEKGKSIHAYLTKSFWYDVGSTDQYEKLENSVIEQALGYLFPSKNHEG